MRDEHRSPRFLSTFLRDTAVDAVDQPLRKLTTKSRLRAVRLLILPFILRDERHT